MLLLSQCVLSRRPLLLLGERVWECAPVLELPISGVPPLGVLHGGTTVEKTQVRLFSHM